MGNPPGQRGNRFPSVQAGVPIALSVVVLESRVLGRCDPSSSTVHKNPLSRVPPSRSVKRKEGSCRFAVPLALLGIGGFEGTGPFLLSSLARRWSQAQLPSFEEKLRERLPFPSSLLVPSSSLLRPRHASPFRRPRSRDYRQRDRSLLACFLPHPNHDQPSQLALRRPKHKSTTREAYAKGNLMGSRDQI